MKSPLLLTVCSLFLLAATAPFASGQNLIQNGNFDAGLDHWERSAPASATKVVDEGGNQFLRVENTDPKIGFSVNQTVKVEPGQWFEFTGRIWVKRITPGTENWHNARVQMSWKDGDNKDVKPWPPSAGYTAVTDGWVSFQKFLKAPPGAVSLLVAPAVFYSSAEASFDDLELKIVNELDVPAADRAKAK